MAQLSFSELLEALDQLPEAQQESISEIIRNRLRARRRAEIAENARTARELYRGGELPKGTVDEMVADLLRGLE